MRWQKAWIMLPQQKHLRTITNCREVSEHLSPQAHRNILNIISDLATANKCNNLLYTDIFTAATIFIID